jgi:hypothetical protein
MLAGGGAAIARFLGGPLAIAAPSAREQAATEAVERATRGMPAPRIKDITVIQVGGGRTNHYSGPAGWRQHARGFENSRNFTDQVQALYRPPK